MTDSNAIEVDSLTKLYGKARGVESITLSVPEGSLFGFLGPNGAGKTTTLRLLLGFLRPTSGSARVLGLDAWHDSPRVKEDVGYVPGDLRLYPWLTAREALRISGAVRRRDLLARGLELCEAFGLDPTIPVRSMSRGTRQKVGLVLAMAPGPRLLVLDEPTSALDPLVQEHLRAELRRAAAEGRTVFFSSHTLGEVESLCDRVAILREGRLVAVDTLEALRRATGHEVVVRFADPGRPASLAPPEGLRIESVEGASVRATFHGKLPVLLEWLRHERIEDLSISRPDLETVFRRYYGAGRQAAGGAA